MGDPALLVEAVRKGDAAAVESLLKEDPARARAAHGGVSLVLLAVYHGHDGLVPLFEAYRTLDLPEAAATGNVGRVRQLLASEPGLANAYSSDGFPALGLACFFGQPEIAELLLQGGADPNAASRNVNKVTPLHAAATRGDARIVARLLARGADPNAKQQKDYTPLHSAAACGDVASVDILLAHGARPGARSEDGRSPADLAAERGHVGLADRLTKLAG